MALATLGLSLGTIALVAALVVPPHAGIACVEGCVSYTASFSYAFSALFVGGFLGMGILALLGVIKGRRQRRRAAELARLRERTY